MPNTNTSRTIRCCQATRGRMERFHAEPIWFTMFFAVSHASSLARAGSRLDPLRKNRRVKVMKTKVWKTDQAWLIQALALDSFASLGMTEESLGMTEALSFRTPEG